MFGALELNNNADPDKYGNKGYDIWFNSRSLFSWSDGSWSKNVIIFGADMSSSVHVDNKKKDILVLGVGSTQGLDNTTITPEAKYPVIFTDSENDLYQFCWWFCWCSKDISI